ncbi:clathrin adaptor, mu subunit [Kipferlia bialata]|uniref:Clathrin adaptor, mu subunit n=1 Tax=Kipferlia bialata TaxID=797122 RepID=A0A9K3D0H4_9EUKA|nr:clathrin adaptor, mu subunit [Kipferlia bialata]|eukprot:g6995.t1
MISAVWVLDSRGGHIIHKDYRGDVSLAARSSFVSRVVNGQFEDEDDTARPVFFADGICFGWIMVNNIYFVGVSRQNLNVVVLIQFLRKLEAVIKAYFRTVDEEVIKDNFTLVYEIFDEIMDFGYPQTTEPDVLKEFIAQRSLKELLGGRKVKVDPTAVPIAVTGAVSWRPQGIKYRRNEVYLDVEEMVRLVVSPDGSTLSADISGALNMRCFLSGMPELKLGLNERVRTGPV